ncbi:unnamed protein product, partial [Medioppia subpectinata]
NILHITDIHLDEHYSPLIEPKCGAPYCCRSNSTTVPSTPDAGQWGSYFCDTPLKLLDNLFATIDWQSIDLVYWTGDVTPHDTWQDSKEGILSASKIITSYLKKYSKSPVIVSLGNHMAVPVGTFSPPDITNSLSTRYVFDHMIDEWSELFPTDQLSSFRSAGYYTIKIRPGFRVIVVNTNYCARLNIWTYYQPIDPANQLKWLSNQLDLAEKASEFVHIVGHIPPDNRECTQGWLYNYLNIIERYSNTIVGQFYGHTHYDELRVYYSNYDCNKVIGFGIISPSVTPYDGSLRLNPAYRLVKIRDNGIIDNIETYSLDLSRANTLQEGSTPEWPLEYSMY